MILAILSGIGIGLFSGILIGYFGMAAFVVTLGVMAIGRSLAYIFSGQQPISDVPESLSNLVYTSFLGIQTNVLILLVLYLIAWLYLTYTKGGRTIYAVGSNREAARTAGLNVLFYSVLPYMISGALSCVAVILLSGQILSIDPLAGNLLELDAIAAVVIGGASLYGGARHHHRHAHRRVHHGDDPQRPEPDGRVALLAGFGHRRDHHRRRAGRTADQFAHPRLDRSVRRSDPCPKSLPAPSACSAPNNLFLPCASCAPGRSRPNWRTATCATSA